MIVSEARLEANRRNARRSTGPKSEAGKERSRRNALTHGLSAEVVRLPEDEAAVAASSAPTTAQGLDWEAWLAGEVAVLATRLRRCERLDQGHRDRVVIRAERSWDDDRKMEAEALGRKLADDPSGVARALRMTPQGCDWMIERWSHLARIAERERTWNAEQRSLAFALLGRPEPLQGRGLGEAIDLEGRVIPASYGMDIATLARQEVADLLRRKAERTPLDEFDRSEARADAAPDDADPALRKLRRHENALHRRLRWCIDRLDRGDQTQEPTQRPAAPPAPPLAVESPARPAPTDPTPAGPFDASTLFGPLYAETPARPASTRRPDPKALKLKARRDARRTDCPASLGRKTNPIEAAATPSIRPEIGVKLAPG